MANVKAAGEAQRETNIFPPDNSIKRLKVKAQSGIQRI